MIDKATRLYDSLNLVWQEYQTSRWISKIMIFGFSIGLVVVFCANNFGFPVLPSNTNYFLSISIAFQVLLIVEILGLIFVLSGSVADSVGKQFEILSIILLRSSFKEFGQVNHTADWLSIRYEPIFYMLSDAFGALMIFLIIGFYYRSQKHVRITKTDDEQEEFVRFKKILALILLIVFIYLGCLDLYQLFTKGHYVVSFNAFYTTLIFADILILLFSLRFSSKYYNLFRYSSFAFATILIRISLTAPPYVNVLVGIVAGLFVLGMTLVYNYFQMKIEGD